MSTKILASLLLLSTVSAADGYACRKFICAKESEKELFKHQDHWKCGIENGTTEMHIRQCGKWNSFGD